MSQIVAIVGRPNVGKSTLYNRLVGERQAIIDDVSGVTRDRIYGFCEWNGKSFSVVDTGGFVHGSDDVFEAAIRTQVNIAIEEASVIIFLTDATTGITSMDEEVANLLRRTKKRVFLVVNKADNHNRMLMANEFWGLGIEDTFFIAAISGSGTGDLLDAVTEALPEETSDLEEDIPKFTIIGQPNVGKSSLTNALLGEDRNIVTDIAGTTRDSIHSRFNKYDKDFYLIDTAGIRKKSKVHEDLEFYSVMRAIKSIDDCDVAILMIEANSDVTSQDLKLIQLAYKRRKGLVIVINKWDLVENKETNSVRDYEAKIREKIAPFTDVPIIFTSVIEKQRIMKVIDVALEVHENRQQKIKTSYLNKIMQEEIERYPPPAYRGRFVKVNYVAQLPLYYPAFAFYSNHPKHIKESYRNFLENKLRKHFNFHGVPISVFIKQK